MLAGVEYILPQKREQAMALKKVRRKPKGDLVKELDAAIALLTRVRSLAAAVSEPKNSEKSTVKHEKRTLSAEGREAIAAAQRKRWAKAKRQKKQSIQAGGAK